MATLSELTAAAKAELSSRLLNGRPVLDQSNFDVIASFVSFLQFANETGIENLNASVTPVTAIGSSLDGWGSAYGVARLGTSRATGLVTIFGTAGSTLPAGTTLTRCDGIEYETTEAITLTGASGSVNVQSVTLGEDANFQNGGALDMGSVVAGISGDATSLGIVGGSDIECDDDYRSRVLSQIRTRCRTGTAEDYEFWVSQYPGVTRICVDDKGNGPGTVKVYFMMDDTYANGVPSPADVAAVDALVPWPLGIVGEVCAPVVFPVDVSVTGSGVLTSAEFDIVQEALENAFLDFFDCGASVLCTADLEVALRSVLEGCYSLVLPASNVAIPSGQVPILGTLTLA